MTPSWWGERRLRKAERKLRRAEDAYADAKYRLDTWGFAMRPSEWRRQKELIERLRAECDEARAAVAEMQERPS